MMETWLTRQKLGHTYQNKKVIFFIVFVFNVFLFIFYITPGSKSSWMRLSTFTNDTVPLTTIANKTAPSPISLICDRKTTKISQPCLCYVDMDDNVTDELVVVSGDDSRALSNYSETKCAMTVDQNGRLGNVMGAYATLYGLSKLNERPAFMLPDMAQTLSMYFKVSLPALSKPMVSRLRWTNKWVHDWMEESYTKLEGQFIKLTGYPNSFTFYEHVATEIKREFALRDDIQNKAEQILRELVANRSSTTFVGVHVRRGDYVKLMNEYYKGVLAETDFFVRATNYFRSRYSDAIFVVVSNDMNWCQKNIPNDRGDIHFIGNNLESDPITDFSLLVNCNHTIFTIGTYGYWAAYLAGGEVIYLANFTLRDSSWHRVVHDEAMYLPQWIPIAADLSAWTSKPTTVKTSTQTTTTEMLRQNDQKKVVNSTKIIHR